MSGKYAPVQSEYLDRMDRARHYRLHCEKLASDEHAIDDRVVPARHLMLATARKNQIRKEKMDHEQELINEVLQYHYELEQKRQKNIRMSIKRAQKQNEKSNLPKMNKTKHKNPQKTASRTKKTQNSHSKTRSTRASYSYNTASFEEFEEEEEEPLAYSVQQTRKPIVSGTTFVLFEKKEDNDSTPYYSRNVINQIIEENGMKEIAQPPPIL